MADLLRNTQLRRTVSAVRQDDRQVKAAAVWDEVAEERQALEDRTSRLRALRLAREANSRS